MFLFFSTSFTLVKIRKERTNDNDYSRIIYPNLDILNVYRITVRFSSSTLSYLYIYKKFIRVHNNENENTKLKIFHIDDLSFMDRLTIVYVHVFE